MEGLLAALSYKPYRVWHGTLAPGSLHSPILDQILWGARLSTTWADDRPKLVECRTCKDIEKSVT